ncbi:hypothetical protein MUN82_12290 [Hymenobacter aerilatus]|uniref:Uncharacterized protein n=1 Tax=Hymenobacter aerilatus TaxID=2932251 RepID=A0A8T9SPU1_9BACT|nr:hypothetical protein [Hymenobacter aerilatus]UOR03727.1 hypothetical protein MUN82_12290 [Hymenobacter aerilatus]
MEQQNFNITQTALLSLHFTEMGVSADGAFVFLANTRNSDAGFYGYKRIAALDVLNGNYVRLYGKPEGEQAPEHPLWEGEVDSIQELKDTISTIESQQ